MSRKNLNGIVDESAPVIEENRSEIRINFAKETGEVKPLHGINNSPITYGDALPELKEAGIPFVRLHDTAGLFGGTCFVDIPNIFPDFDADANDPESYDFAFTDAYLKGLVASGTEIYYRLGVTIENQYRIKAHRIHPPKDFAKWAQICAGIIRHYNEGWANGFHYNIRYWEIWNEPENPPMWTGTREQYFELYRTAANALKKEFPEIKVGGYASCGFYAINREDVGDFHKSFLTYFDEFLKFVTSPETSAPLDFFSWHLYTSDPHEIIIHAEHVAKKLKEYNLVNTESHFNEWNYVDWKDPDIWDSIKEMPGAIFTATAFCLMQNSTIDKALYYDALPTRRYCGLYYFPSCKQTKTYYSFKAFNELYKLGTAIECECIGLEDTYVCAAKDNENNGAVMIVNGSHKKQDADLSFAGLDGVPLCYLLDNSRTLTETNQLVKDKSVSLLPKSVVLLKFG